MKLRIKKNVLKEEYLFYVTLQYKSYSCTLRLCATEKEYPATISEDFTHIVLENPLPLKGYGKAIGGLAGYGESKTKEITKVKLSRENSYKAREWALGL